MNPTDLTPEGLKQRIIAKYPNGVSSDGKPYAQMDAADLAQRISQKYPDGVTNDGHKYSEFLGKSSPTTQVQSHPVMDAIKGFSSAVAQPFADFHIPQTVVKVAGAPVSAVAKALGKSDPFADISDSSIPSARPLNPERVAGDVTQIGSYFVPGGGILGAAATGALQGAGSAMSENASPTTVGVSGLLGAPLGVFGSLASKGLGTLAKGASGSEALRASATKDIADILKPTTKVNKAITQEVAPELAKKGIIAPSRGALGAKAEAQVEDIGSKIGAAWDALPEDAKFQIDGLFKSLDKASENLKVNGIIPNTFAQNRITALQGLKDNLAQIAGGTSADGTPVFADARNIRQLRQILDLGKKDFSATDLDAASKFADKTLANAIREEISTQNPDIAKLNKDFHFWSNVSKVIKDTEQRMTGQSGLIRKLGSEGLGAIAGTTTGHPLIGAAVMRGLTEFLDSTAWKTTSATIKSKLADALEAANYTQASNIIAKAMSVVGNAISNPIAPKAFTGGLLPSFQTSNH